MDIQEDFLVVASDRPVYYHEQYLPNTLLLAAPRPILAPAATVKKPSFGLVLMVMLAGIVGLGAQMSWRAAAESSREPGVAQTRSIVANSIHHDLDAELPKIKVLEDAQTATGIKVVDDQTIQTKIVSIQIEVEASNYHLARSELRKLTEQVAMWQHELDLAVIKRQHDAAEQAAAIAIDSVTAPILLYHYPPPDFEAQLQYLQSHGYTTIDFDQLAASLNNKAKLPAKPVIITFDDGFGAQWSAFALLKKYQMKATFYIIDAGEASKYCIGAGRNYNQGYKCGDSYLNWDQVRELDQSGLISIASHTVDHLGLATQSPEVQRFQIIEGKHQLESQIGHSVRHFAYPYGSYSATTIAIVREAGFITATTTLPGTIHTQDSLLTLHRVRSALKLP